MSHANVLRAWKDAAFQQSLSDAERAELPPNPAGIVKLTEDDLDVIVGGRYALTRLEEACHG